MRDVTQASLILVLFHSGISYLLRKKLVPQATIPVPFPFTPTHFSSCPFSFMPSILLVPALPYPWALFSLSSACPQPACYLFSHALVPSPLSSTSTPPKILTYFSSTYTPLNSPSSSCPSLLALPNSPGPSWSSCTQPPPLGMPSCQLSFRLQRQELREDKGKISPGTAHCCNGKRLNLESNQLTPQSPKIKHIQLSGHQKNPKGQNMLRGHRIFRALQQYAQMCLGLRPTALT